jgi:hypothetical protein
MAEFSDRLIVVLCGIINSSAASRSCTGRGYLRPFNRCEMAVASWAGANGFCNRMLLGTPWKGHSPHAAEWLGSGSSSPSRTVSGFYYLITGTPLFHGIKLTQRVQQLANLFAQFAIDHKTCPIRELALTQNTPS